MYTPTGVKFYDGATGREMILVTDEEPREGLRGWLVYRHAEGHWVTLRKATAADREAVMRAMSAALHD